MAKDSDDLNLPIGKWLLIGIGALALITLGYIGFNMFLASESDGSESTDTTLRPQVEWAIDLVDSTGSAVILKGDQPFGFPTETWVDGVLAFRNVGETFEWNMEVDPEVPTKVFETDQIAVDNADDQPGLCQALEDRIRQLGDDLNAAAGDAEKIPAQAFAQHAVNLHRSEGCS